VDLTEIYSGYLYQSSITFGLSSFYRRLSRDLISRLNLREKDLVIDVGSNDGTFLEFFLQERIRVLGVEPSAKPSEISKTKGIPTVSAFLTEEVASQVVAEHGKASLVCANYVAANVPNPVQFFNNIRMLLADEGEVSVITGYHPDQFAVNMFEYINHDHLAYFSVASSIKLAEASGLALVSANRVEHKGGSIHLTFRRRESGISPDDSVAKLLQREKWLGVQNPETYETLANRISSIAVQTRLLLEEFPGQQAVGIGASISSTHLLHQLRIGTEVFSLFDDDTNKVGRFSPGFGIKVYPMVDIVDHSNHLAVMLAWQHTDRLLDRIKDEGFMGKIVIPLPNPEILSIS
jgi:SAM-dependent methyltransferase